MSHLNDIIKSSSYRIGANAASMVISILFMAYFARVFTKEQMAVYATLTILSAWNEVLGGLGLGTLVVKAAATLVATEQLTGARQLISSVLVYRTTSLFILSLIWTTLATFGGWEFLQDNDYSGLVGIVIWTSFVTSCRTTIGNIQVSVQRFGSREAINVVTVLCQRAFCVVGFFAYGVIGFYWGFLFATLMGLLLGLYDIRSYLTGRLIPFPRIFRDARSYLGLKLLRSGLDHVDRPVIAMLMGAESLAGYHVAKRLFDNFYGLCLAVIVPAGVKFGELRGDPNALREYYRQCLIFIAYLCIPLGFFMAVVGTPLLYLYAGEKYLPNATIVMNFGFTLMGVALWTLLREVALRLLKPRYLAYQYGLSAVVTMAAYVTLLPAIGLAGVPLAMGLGYFAGLLPMFIKLERDWGLTVPLRYMYMALGAGVCVMAMAVPLLFIDSYIAQLIIGMSLSGLAYMGWILIVGPSEAVEVLKGLKMRLLSAISHVSSKGKTPAQLPSHPATQRNDS